MHKLIIAAAAFAAIAPAMPAAASSAPLTQAETRLGHISVVKLGAGSPVVFIPGLGSPRASWDGVVPALAKTHSVYLVQVNGFGGDTPGANLQAGVLDGIVADLSGYLAARKVGPVALVGHSMGGLASLMFAQAHPRQVDRVMIVDALPWFPVLLAQGGPDPAPSQVAAMATMMRDKVAARFGKPVDPATIKTDVDGLAVRPDSRVQMAKWAAAADSRVTAELLYEDMSTDLRPALPALAMPVTVVVPWSATAGFGKERTMAFYKRQYAATPHVSFVDVADAGHFVMLDQPAAFAAALETFLKP